MFKVRKIGNALIDPTLYLEHLTGKGTVYTGTYTKYLTFEAQSLVHFSLWLAVPRYNVHVQGQQNRKCTEWPQTELEHLTVKGTLYTLNTYPWGSNFGLFCSTIKHFQDTTCTRLPINRNCTEWPQTKLQHWNSQKYSIYTKYLPQGRKIMVRFTLWLAVSKIQHDQGHRKSC